MRFEWDDAKADQNERKHGIAFEEAAEILCGDYVAFRARVHGENRTKAIGRSAGEYIAVIYTERGDGIRIISARHATQSERSSYDQYFG